MGGLYWSKAARQWLNCDFLEGLIISTVAIQLEQALSYFDPHTIKKGTNYFESGRVKSCASKDGKIIGVVIGRQEYITRISISSGNEIETTYCTCPVGGDCKHTVALLMKYAEQARDNLNRNEKLASVASRLNNLSLIQSSSASPPAIPASDKSGLPLRALPMPSSEIRHAILRLSTVAGLMPSSEVRDEGLKNSKSPKAKIGYVIDDNSYNLQPRITAVRVNLRKDGSCGNVYNYQIENLIEKSSQYISNEDVEIAKLYNTLKGESYYSYYSNRAKIDDEPELLKLFLQRILATGRTYLTDNYSRALTLGQPLPGQFKWIEIDSGEQLLCVIAEKEGASFPCLRWSIPWYLDLVNYAVGPVELPASREFVREALKMPPVSKSDAECLQFMLPSMGLDAFMPSPKSKRQLQKRVIKPVPHLQLVKPSATVPGTKSAAQMPALSFANHYEQAISNEPFLENGEFITVQPDRKQEQANAEILSLLGFSEVSEEQPTDASNLKHYTSADPRAWLNLLNRSDELKESGWNIPAEIIEKFSPIEASDDDLDLQVSNENSWWFSLEMHVEIAGKKRPLLPVLLSAIRSLPDSKSYSPAAIDALNTNGKFIAMLDDGRILSLPYERIKPILISIHELFLKDSLLSADGNKLKLSVLDAAAMFEADHVSASEWRGAENVLDLASRFRKLAGDTEAVISDSLSAELRSYQKTGLAWLQRLAEQKFGGILADDMGLGKTVQLLAFITAAADAGALKKRPFLVMCPKTVLPNWLSECAKFAPKLKVLALHGQQRGSNMLKAQVSDLVITSFPLLARDIDVLKEIKWSGIALDESQAIKNPDTQIAKAACALKADFRFCLTGTPIENNLGELWSQFRFLLPGFLGDKAEFKTLFQNPIEKEGDNSRRTLLASRVKPFILRRTKDEVATDLPQKSVVIQNVEIEGAQLDLYETVRLSMTKQVRDEIVKKGFKSSQIIILDALLKLRQICCDPRLVKLNAARKIPESAKLNTLLEMLEELRQESRKVLVFSQFTSMLDLIAEELKKREIGYVELRGDTRNREKPVVEFQTTDVPVFLLSLKAGGTGLNLTAADVVIHYDPWWNPAAEDQATDRAHRIGQTKKVFVYKLVVKGSIEERMMQLQERKKALAASIYEEDGGSSGRLLDENDIDLLLRPIDSLD